MASARRLRVCRVEVLALGFQSFIARAADKASGIRKLPQFLVHSFLAGYILPQLFLSGVWRVWASVSGPHI